MGEARRDVELASVSRSELVGLPLHVGGRARSDVDEDIIDGASEAADKLDLLVRRSLEVHATERAGTCRMRNTVLHESGRQPGGGELLRTERTREEPRSSFTGSISISLTSCSRVAWKSIFLIQCLRGTLGLRRWALWGLINRSTTASSPFLNHLAFSDYQEVRSYQGRLSLFEIACEPAFGLQVSCSAPCRPPLAMFESTG